jgi:putative DNA primase/helicase
MYDFLRMDIPERPWVLEPLIKKGDLLEIHSWRGTGKTQLAVGMSMAIASGGQIMHWKAPEPQGIIYVEGEMSTDEMKKRFLKQAGGMSITDDQYKALIKNFILLQHEVLSRSGIKMKSLRSVEGLNDLELFVADMLEFSPVKISALVLDNLSCLHGGDENEATTWENLKHFLVRMRVMGVSVIVLHHSAKSGVSRGHSTMEDQLDVVLKLDSKKYFNEEGAKFDVRFEKARGLSGRASRSFTAHMQDGEDGMTSSWFKVKKTKSTMSMDDVNKVDRIAELRAQNWSYDNIATEMRMSKHTVMKYARAIDDDKTKEGD